MTGHDARTLCLALMKADSEDEVIDLLKKAGYWNDPAVWRFYGDYENNYNTIGNQQSRPDCRHPAAISASAHERGRYSRRRFQTADRIDALSRRGILTAR